MALRPAAKEVRAIIIVPLYMENLYRWCDYASSPRCRRQAMEAFLAAESRKRQQQVHLSTTESIVLGERSSVVYANTYTTQPRAAGGGGRGGGRSPARPAQLSGPSRGVYTALAFYLEHLLSSALLYGRAGCLTAKNGGFRPGQWRSGGGLHGRASHCAGPPRVAKRP
jgi:hypothetical protein